MNISLLRDLQSDQALAVLPGVLDALAALHQTAAGAAGAAGSAGATNPADPKQAAAQLLAMLANAADPLWQSLKAEAAAKLRAERDTLLARFPDGISALLKALASQVDGFATMTRLPLIKAGADGTPDAGKISFALGETVDLALEIQSVDNATATAFLGRTPANQTLLRVGASGAVASHANGALSFGWGGMGATGSGAFPATLNWYLLEPGARTLLEAVRLDFGNLPMLGQLDDALAASALPPDSGGWAALECLVDGVLDIGGQFSAGKVANRQFAGLSPDVPPISVSATVGATASFSLRREGKYQLRIIPAAGRLTVSLENAELEQSSSALSLGMDLQVSGLAPSIALLTDRWMPSSGPLSQRLAGLSNPGKWLSDRIDRQFVGDGLKAALAHILAGQGGGADVSSALAVQLGSKIKAEVSEHLPVLNLSASEATAKLVDGLIGRLGVDQPFQAQARSQLGAGLLPLVSSLHGEVQTKLDEVIADLQAMTKDAASDALAPLTRIGAQIKPLVDQLDGAAAQTRAKIQEWLAAYEKARVDLSASLVQHAQENLGISLTQGTSRTRRRSVLLQATFLKATPASRQFYQVLCLGRIGDLTAMLDLLAADGGSVAGLGGSVVDTVTAQSKVGLSINFFGWKIDDSQIDLREVTVKTDLNGRVIAAKSGADFTSVSANWMKQAQANLGIDLGSMPLASLSDGGALVPLSAGYSLADGSLSEKDIAGYADSMVKAGLARPGLAAACLALLRRDLPGQTQGWSGTVLSSKIVLTETEWRAFLARDGGVVQQTMVDVLLAVARSNTGLAEEIDDNLARLSGTLGVSDLEALGTASGAVNSANWTQFWDQTIGKSEEVCPGTLRRVGKILWYVGKLSVSMREAQALLKAAQGSLDQLDAAPGAAGMADIRAQLEAQMKRVNQLMGNANQASTSLIKNDSAIPWMTLGFYRTLGTLAGRAPLDTLVSAVSYPQAGGTAQALLA